MAESMFLRYTDMYMYRLLKFVINLLTKSYSLWKEGYQLLVLILGSTPVMTLFVHLPKELGVIG